MFVLSDGKRAGCPDRYHSLTSGRVRRAIGRPSPSARPPHRPPRKSANRSEWSPHRQAASLRSVQRSAADEGHGQPMAPPDHRPDKIRKRQTATQAIEPPARHQKGRTDEAAQHPIDLARPKLRTARSRSGCRSASSKRQGSARTIWAGQPKAIKRCELRQRAWLRVPLSKPPAPATGRTALLDLRRPLRYAGRNYST